MGAGRGLGEIGNVQILVWNFERDSEISPLARLAQMCSDSPRDLITIICNAGRVVNCLTYTTKIFISVLRFTNDFLT
jgi:hypothetical protein